MALFLSYSRADEGVAFRFADGLKAAGVGVWVDQHDIRPSEHWDRAVEAALRSSDAVIVILSPRSAASANVADEVSVALDSGKTVIPILIEHCAAPLRMARLQFIDATRDLDAALNRCLEAISALPGPPPAHPPATTIPAESLGRVTAALTVQLGPIAGRLVEREARDAPSLAQLVDRLAAQIPNERDRAAFRNAAAG